MRLASAAEGRLVALMDIFSADVRARLAGGVCSGESGLSSGSRLTAVDLGAGEGLEVTEVLFLTFVARSG